MANKTIHQLTPASTITSDTQFAIYDTVSDSTKKATASQILGTEDILYADDPSTPSGTVDFTTQDTSLNPASTVSVDLLTGSDSWSQRFVKISQMFKNIRYLLGKTKTIDDKFGNVNNSISDFDNATFFKSKFSQQTSMIVLPFSATTTNQPTDSPTWGYCLLYFGTDENYFKIFYVNATNEVYTRTYSNDSWENWNQLISNKVIVGDNSVITAGSGITITQKNAFRAGNVVFINVVANKTDGTVFTGRINPLFTINDTRFLPRVPFNVIASTNASVGGLTTGAANIYVTVGSYSTVLMDTFTASQKEVRVALCFITY